MLLNRSFTYSAIGSSRKLLLFDPVLPKAIGKHGTLTHIMLSLKKCRLLLDPETKKYTDQQILLIRDYLMELAQFNILILKKAKSKKVIRRITKAAKLKKNITKNNAA